MCRELRLLLRMGEHHGAGHVRNEALYARDELIRQLVVDPAAFCVHAASTRKVPWQLEHSLLFRSEQRDVDDVLRTGGDHAPHRIETSTHPDPVATIIEALATLVARRLRFAIQSRSLVRPPRPIPTEIVRHAGAA